MNQYIVYLTYGITQHFEVSAALPFSNVRMSVVSHATIVPNSFASQPPYIFNRFNFFQPQIAQAAPAPNITVPNCPAAPCYEAVFSDSRSVTGLGDVVVRAKYQFYQGERLRLAGGLDARLPTGNEENFLGSGTLGLKPFVIASLPRADLAPRRSGIRAKWQLPPLRQLHSPPPSTSMDNAYSGLHNWRPDSWTISGHAMIPIVAW